MADVRSIAGCIVRMSANPPSIEVELWPRCSVHMEAKKETLCRFSANYLFKNVIVEYEIDKHGYPILVDIHERKNTESGGA